VQENGCLRSQVFTYSASDACGNSTSAQVTYTWKVDTTPPSITCPGPVTVATAGAIPAPATDYASFVTAGGAASDTCVGAVTVTHMGDVMATSNSPTSFVITRTYQASDACGNSETCAQTITVAGVETLQISGTVSYSTLVSSNYTVSRVVEFKATDVNSNVLQTWTGPLTFVNDPDTGVASAPYTLTDVPAGTVAVSAKTAWHLREKQTGLAFSGGAATANFTLRGGDIYQSNSINIQDYAILAAHWFSDPVYEPADINGDGMVQLLDYLLMQANWFQLGHPQ
jgi:hypothetical protein